ncbi:MAG: hypothetical protein QOI71_1965 [Gaiellales bacterium]|nr:hypothetical protein [Gaiellales bacterium]
MRPSGNGPFVLALWQPGARTLPRWARQDSNLRPVEPHGSARPSRHGSRTFVPRVCHGGGCVRRSATSRITSGTSASGSRAFEPRSDARSGLSCRFVVRALVVSRTVRSVSLPMRVQRMAEHSRAAQPAPEGARRAHGGPRSHRSTARPRSASAPCASRRVDSIDEHPAAPRFGSGGGAPLVGGWSLARGVRCLLSS